MAGDPDVSDFLEGGFGPRGMQVTTSSGEQAYKDNAAASPSKHVWMCGVPRTLCTEQYPFPPIANLLWRRQQPVGIVEKKNG